MKRLQLLIGIFLLFSIISFPVFAAEQEETKFYITEETTQWDVVEATDPDHDKIPDEIKQQMKESYVIPRGPASGMFIAISNKLLIPLCIGAILVPVVYVSRKKNKRKDKTKYKAM